MRSFPLRSISGRIALGFFVLLATFGIVSVYTIVRMRQLGSDLQFVRTAYLETSLTLAQLSSYQSGMVDQLDSPTPVPRPMVKHNREVRVQIVERSLQNLDELGDLPEAYQRAVATIEQRLRKLRDDYKQNEPLFEQLLAPNIDTGDRIALTAKLSLAEHGLRSQINFWFTDLKSDTIRITLSLERVERQATLAAIVLGAIGAFLGILVTVWSVLTLRPLRRLHDAVRNVAGGNYRDRVSVVGGTEVSDLAREFNVMAGAIEEREQELVRSERLAAVGKMAAVITHEIRNPLSSIGLNAELLEEDLERVGAGKEAVGLCRSIRGEVDRLTAITEEYLRFARLPRPRLERESINAVVGGVIAFQREDLAARGVTVVAQLAETLPLVAIDEAQLRQALLNLMRNAVEAMGAKGGELTITTRRVDADAHVEIVVRDGGAGIAAEHLPHIFEPFFSTKDGGTGLGLALTQQIVAEHGGRIAVDSAVGRGTTFTLTLPPAVA